jgi:hypothetical protein
MMPPPSYMPRPNYPNPKWSKLSNSINKIRILCNIIVLSAKDWFLLGNILENPAFFYWIYFYIDAWFDSLGLYQ